MFISNSDQDMLKYLFVGILLLSVVSSVAQTRSDSLLSSLKDANNGQVFTVAHRGDWRNAPENSLPAIQRCINMGIEIVEIDVRMTKDSVFVLMHDGTIDRTTTGTGEVAQLTWQEIQAVNLKNGIGSWTKHKVPRLEEVLELTKGKILLNLDKTYEHIDLLYRQLLRYGMQHQAIFKGWMKTYDDVEAHLTVPIDSIHFMPIVITNDGTWQQVLISYADRYQPLAVELIFDDEAVGKEAIQLIEDIGTRVWINALWPDMNAGHDDDLAIDDPDAAYGWLLEHGASVIQTDRPLLLKQYLLQR